MLRLVYGLLNCFEQSFKYSFISGREEKNQKTNKQKTPTKQIKTNERPEPVRKCQSGEKSRTRQRPYLTRIKWPQNSWWSEEVSSCMHWKAQTEPTPDSSPSFANKALTFPAINFSNHCAVLACRSRATQKITSRLAALNCLQFIYGLCWHIVGEFVCHRRKERLWLHAEKWASNGESCAKEQQHWPALDCPIQENVWTLNSLPCVWSQKGLAGNLTQSSAKQYILFVHS